RHEREPPLFPPRRSSDLFGLANPANVRGGAFEWQELARAAGFPGGLCVLVEAAGARREAGFLDCLLVRLGYVKIDKVHQMPLYADRKSTRLNSSHVKSRM